MLNPLGHSPYGECGLKFIYETEEYHEKRHSPYGECGLKSYVSQELHNVLKSLSIRRVWIEIPRNKLIKPLP